MSFFSWLRNRTSNCAPRGSGQHRPSASRFRPRLEALEGRWLPSTLTVTNNLDSGPGSLRAEIAAAQNNDKIVFAPSLNGQTIALTSGGLRVSTGVTIQGPGAGQLTVSGHFRASVFYVSSSQPVTVTGLTISPFGGGGIYVSSIQPVTLTGLTIKGGLGGISNYGSNLTVSACAISNCRGVSGGGIYNAGTLTLSGCTISGDSATQGGGIFNAGTLTATNCTLSGDVAIAGGGGGIYNMGQLTARGCTLSGDSATQGGRGGGICVSGSRAQATLTNCTIAGNLAIGSLSSNSGGGGGVYMTGAIVTNLTNCTVSLNQARDGFGGGIYALSGNGNLNINNTIVAGNYASYGGPDIYGNWAGSHDLIGINALLGPLQNNGGPTQTMAVLAGSPAIGHADNSKAPATDQRGVTRLDTAGETTDIGAFELTGAGSASATAFSLTLFGTAPAAGMPVNTVPAAEVTPRNVANPDVHVGMVPFNNTDSAVGRTTDAFLKTTPRESGNQKIAAADELFPWNAGSDTFGAF
jgi:hypothetical protein